ncbi:hypothetical protein AA0521_2794 [Komagataeibacter intermedius NRIC 0521]|uniref:Transposase n=1 Tax=Komagataeibacter intermedius NRIC 0521 TaxID=1307934 RepID=A0ABQ0PQK2_9PROT|nr:hypothetical protein AA0521_2794 [Komagataeibacter intermedius NRIC 0521]
MIVFRIRRMTGPRSLRVQRRIWAMVQGRHAVPVTAWSDAGIQSGRRAPGADGRHAGFQQFGRAFGAVALHINPQFRRIA